MSDRRLPTIAIALIVVGILGLGAAMAWDAIAGRGERGVREGGVEQMFIENMVPHHDDAIEMAELASTRAEHPELKALAADIHRTQTAENARMRAWYREWFGTDLPEDGSGGMGGMMGGRVDMERLETAEEFDKAFIEEMIPHHRMAIMMARMAGGRSRRPEFRAFTSAIVRTQSREIEQMRAWYDEWYGS